MISFCPSGAPNNIFQRFVQTHPCEEGLLWQSK
jgi:hypothetical protein